MADNLSIWALAIAAAGALFAGWAAHETQKTSRAHIISSLLDSYAAPEMLRSIVTLLKYKEQQRSRFAVQFRADRQDNYDALRPIDEARRHLTHYYEKAVILVRADLLSAEDMARVISPQQIAFARNYLEPLEEAIRCDYDHDLFDELARLHSPWLPKVKTDLCDPVV